MRTLFRRTLLAVAAWACAVWSPLAGRAPAPSRSAPDSGTTACSLLSNADVEKATGRHLFTPPDATSLAGGAGSACTFDIAQLMLFFGDKSEESWDEYVRRWGHGDEPRFSVSGLGDRAYGFYPKPRDKYEGVYVVVVARVGQHTIGVAVEADEGQAAESVQPQAIALARMVAAKLRTGTPPPD